jgi:transcriptional regulator with XRE-family HTH domain
MTPSIAERTRHFRENIGLSVDDAAQRGGMSATRWQAIEDGQKPTVGDVLGVSWGVGVSFTVIAGTAQQAWETTIHGAAKDTEPSPAVDLVIEDLIALGELARELGAAGYLDGSRGTVGAVV